MADHPDPACHFQSRARRLQTAQGLGVPKFPERLQEPPRSGFLTDEQYDALQEHAEEPWLRALLAVAYTSGFRRAELVGGPQPKQQPMLVSHIDLKNKTITLDPGKTNEGRVVKMTQEVYDLLKLS